ncbi:hypothetical protein ACV22Y_00890 [Burkholderia sp. AW50-3]
MRVAMTEEICDRWGTMPSADAFLQPTNEKLKETCHRVPRKRGRRPSDAARRHVQHLNFAAKSPGAVWRVRALRKLVGSPGPLECMPVERRLQGDAGKR